MATVLVVDDDQAIREVVRLVLEQEGHTVREAVDGPEGLNMLRTAAGPLVVLLDDLMPHLSGMEVLAEVAREPTLTTGHAYILMTGSARMLVGGTTPELARLRVFIVSKPFDITELAEVVNQAAVGLPGG
jgi:CheY-like chemotaxis protein